MIVAIEGIDAAGKNAQVEELFRHFTTAEHNRFKSIRKHDFPHYETVAGGVVGRILRGQTIIAAREDLDDSGACLSVDALAKRWHRDKAVVVQSIMVANRLEWLPLLVEFAQSPDSLLLLDRYKLSGVAYGAAEGLEANWVRVVQSCIPDADLNILLDISVNESIQRRPDRRDDNERDLDKLHRARGYYLQEFAKSELEDPGSHLVIDGSIGQSEIALKIVGAILRKIEAIKFDEIL